MADKGSTQAADWHPDMDFQEHERTYEGFLVFAKWGVIVPCVILIGMAYFLI